VPTLGPLPLEVRLGFATALWEWLSQKCANWCVKVRFLRIKLLIFSKYTNY